MLMYLCTYISRVQLGWTFKRGYTVWIEWLDRAELFTMQLTSVLSS